MIVFSDKNNIDSPVWDLLGYGNGDRAEDNSGLLLDGGGIQLNSSYSKISKSYMDEHPESRYRAAIRFREMNDLDDLEFVWGQNYSNF